MLSNHQILEVRRPLAVDVHPQFVPAPNMVPEYLRLIEDNGLRVPKTGCLGPNFEVFTEGVIRQRGRFDMYHVGMVSVVVQRLWAPPVTLSHSVGNQDPIIVHVYLQDRVIVFGERQPAYRWVGEPSARVELEDKITDACYQTDT